MDDLKTINEKFGPKEGDFALKLLARAIQKAGGEKSINSRFGGDEFVSAIITKDSAEKTAEEFKTRLEQTLKELVQDSGKPYNVHASVGSKWAVINMRIELNKLISTADELMYTEKSTKKRKISRE